MLLNIILAEGEHSQEVAPWTHGDQGRIPLRHPSRKVRFNVIGNRELYPAAKWSALLQVSY